ncbi:host cell division inhibitor Icd-like protein [Pasteurella caecimuris]|uniref:host cell division inhibitor Icd-like protein n=1 Tax=Rodentibacter caecimuris TaxID=1796644 RepID=UPI00214FB8E4|nr:host cell division inhibitor Icd-like protein [Pasteurella caecimuris]MCR1838105.1 host cell division inhibitor Icd-like protein [Pasteurella caecimuris]MCU0107219.1 host cell division inhibitor Icd-like protein [Pasteurella caecimuris]
MNYLNDNLPFNAVGRNFFTPKNRKFLQSGLTVKTKLNYIKSALAKSKVRASKLVLLLQANSTPNRAFFVRSVYAPIQYSLFSDSLFSMVAHSGKGFALCRFPVITVFEPVMCYRPSLETLAVVPQNLLQETAEMIYKFLCVNRTHPHFNLCVQTIQANNETNARLSLSADFQCLSLIAKINPKFDRTFTQGGIYA